MAKFRSDGQALSDGLYAEQRLWFLTSTWYRHYENRAVAMKPLNNTAYDLEFRVH